VYKHGNGAFSDWSRSWKRQPIGDLLLVIANCSYGDNGICVYLRERESLLAK